MKNTIEEPFRLFFPLGIISLIASIALWLPQLWLSENYPIIAHRTFILNGFISLFIGGFLMTAVPKFSQTMQAKKIEILLYLLATLVALGASLYENIIIINVFSCIQALVLTYFLISRIKKRKANIPYSFAFIFIGLIAWFTSGALGSFFNSSSFLNIHYEGAIIAIILGVGSRLVPGILGHSEIVTKQRSKYESSQTIIQSIPTQFLIYICIYILTYFLDSFLSTLVRTIVIIIIFIKYWRIHKAPIVKTALTNCLWINSWAILLSFVLRVLWSDGYIHASHSLFITGILLICLLIATRVLRAHGNGDIKLENSKILYITTSIILLSGATRVSAYLMPEHYYRHLGYSSLILIAAVLLWSYKYLGQIFNKNNNHN